MRQYEQSKRFLSTNNFVMIKADVNTELSERGLVRFEPLNLDELQYNDS